MAEAGDIVAVSVPFVAGVAFVTFVPMGGAEYALAGCAFAAASFLLLCCLAKGACLPLLLGVYFFLGILCGCSGLILHPVRQAAPRLAVRSMDFLVDLIGRSGLEGRTSSLVEALLTGRRSRLDPSLVRSFRLSGASHILALSGLHLGIIYGIVLRFLSVLGNGRPGSVLRSVAVTAACGFYCMMTGSSPSTVRAFLFISINEISRHNSGRRRRPLAVLCAALMVQLSFNPSAMDSAGFQLSYLAMLGIFTVYPVLESWYPKGPRIDPVRRVWLSLAMSVSCQLFTFPVAYFRFGTFPRFFLLTNLVALPMTEALMVSAVLCLVLTEAGLPCAYVQAAVDKLASMLVFCLETISNL